MSTPACGIVPAAAITPAGGDHYRVFTPYWRAWSELRPRADPARAPSNPHAARAARWSDSQRGRTQPALRPRLRCSAAASALRASSSSAGCARGLELYPQRHDALAEEGTSRLSAYLHFGCLSPRVVLERCSASPAAEAFARQLCWRDFHHQVLAARPDLPSADYRSRGDRWRRDPRQLEAWRAGQTGYPIVDAAMRQLAAEGFMHNRARLIVASFLTKTLYLDWRQGAAHFASLLVDADVANNVGNWQWMAGTGNDTRPNRVLNPIRQAKRVRPPRRLRAPLRSGARRGQRRSGT